MTIRGTGYSDWISAEYTTNETILAFGGDDTIQASSSSYDSIDGSSGNDLINVSYSLGATISSGSGNDVIDASGSHNSSIDGGAGNDRLDASKQSASVYLDGGAGVDTLLGGSGNDTFIGHLDGDSINGGKGYDRADYSALKLSDLSYQISSSGMITLYNALGYDLLSSVEELDFSDAKMKIGSVGSDDLADGLIEYGLGGNDNLSSSLTGATLDGGDGNDTLSGGASALLLGGNGDDLIIATDKSARVDGGNGVDTFDASSFISLWSGFWNYNYGILGFEYGSNTVTLKIDQQNSMLMTSIENMRFYDAYRGVYVTAQIGTLAGGAGRPIFDSILVGDHIAENSAAGTCVGNLNLIFNNMAQTVNYSLINDANGRFAVDRNGNLNFVAATSSLDYEITRSYGVTVRLTNSLGFTVDKSFLIYVDNVVGSTLKGTAGNDLLAGTGEEDSLFGYAGSDTLIGGAGGDTLSGGSGTDCFVFSAGFGKDIINDFTATGPDQDKLQFDRSVFSDWNTLINSSRQFGADIIIQKNAYDTITLKNTSLTSLTSNNVIFGT